MSANVIHHLTTPAELIAGTDESAYRPGGLATEGFVHCSDPDVTLRVADSYFSESRAPVLVLDIDPDLLDADLVREAPVTVRAGHTEHQDEGRTFPHVYGPIARSAIRTVGTLVPTSAGFADPLGADTLQQALADQDPVADQLTAWTAVARRTIEVLNAPAVAERWDDESVLEHMSVGVLASHLARGITTVERSIGTLGTTRPNSTAADAVPVTAAAGYFCRVFDRTDAEMVELNEAIVDRSVEGARGGPVNLASATAASLDRVLGALDADDALATRVEVFGPTVMGVGDYLDTRLVELAVHLDDLHHSVFGAAAPLPEASASRSIGVLAEVARRRTGTSAAIASLCRTERSDTAFTAF